MLAIDIVYEMNMMKVAYEARDDPTCDIDMMALFYHGTNKHYPLNYEDRNQTVWKLRKE